MNGRLWNESELNYLRQSYPVGGVRAFRARFPERSKGQIYSKVHMMESCRKNYAWTGQEISFLRQVYPTGGAKLFLRRYPWRSFPAVCHQAHRRGIIRRLGKLHAVSRESLLGLYVTKKLSKRQISKMYGVTDCAVETALRRTGIRKRSYGEVVRLRSILKTKKIPEVEEWDLAYLAGVLAGDAHLNRYNYTFDLSVTDKDFALYVYKLLLRIGNARLTKREPKSANHRLQHRVRLSSKNFSLLIDSVSFGRLDTAGKCRFINGFIDSEGSVPVSGKYVGISNTNLKLLKDISDYMKEQHVDNYIYRYFRKKTGHFEYMLYVRDLTSLRHFADVFSFSIGRKQRRLDEISHAVC